MKHAYQTMGIGIGMVTGVMLEYLLEEWGVTASLATFYTFIVAAIVIIVGGILLVKSRLKNLK